MAFQTITGRQIRDHQIGSNHINGKLPESVLDIKWSSKSNADQVLATKIVMDYVQLASPISISSGANSVEVKGISYGVEDMSNSVKGVQLNALVRMRAANGEVLVDGNGKEVKAKFTKAPVQEVDETYTYTLEFFENDGVTPFALDSDKQIEILYPFRTNLADVAENFAANERFVDGAADINSRLDLKQIAKDVFGGAYAYNQDGNAANAKSLYDEIIDRTKGGIVDTEGITASDVIDEVFTARGGEVDLSARLSKIASSTTTAVTNLKNDLASNQAGKGASLVKVEDVDDVFVGSTVEEVVKELHDKADAAEKEVKSARGTKATLDERLDVAIAEDGKLKDHSKIHTHGKHAFTLDADSTTITFADLVNPGLTDSTIAYAVDELDVYVNGMLQAESFNYDVVLDGTSSFVVGLDFKGATIKSPDDVIILKWTVHNR